MVVGIQKVQHQGLQDFGKVIQRNGAHGGRLGQGMDSVTCQEPKTDTHQCEEERERERGNDLDYLRVNVSNVCTSILFPLEFFLLVSWAWTWLL